MRRPMFVCCLCFGDYATACNMLGGVDAGCLGCASAANRVCDGVWRFSVRLWCLDEYAYAVLGTVVLSRDMAFDSGQEKGQGRNGNSR